MDKGLVDYFIDETNRKFNKLENKVDQLLEFKWKVIGGSVGFSILITVAFQLIVFFSNKA